MNDYPAVIRCADYATPPMAVVSAPPVLRLSREAAGVEIRNTVAVQTCGPRLIELRSRTTGVNSSIWRRSSDAAHADLAYNDAGRYFFCPLQEDLWIHWAHENPALILETQLQLYCRINGALTKIWAKRFRWRSGQCPATAKTLFKGNLTLRDEDEDKANNSGLSMVALDYNAAAAPGNLFANGCVTAEFSPYQLRVAVVSLSGTADPEYTYLYFDVQVHEIKLDWGENAAIPRGVPMSRPTAIRTACCARSRRYSRPCALARLHCSRTEPTPLRHLTWS